MYIRALVLKSFRNFIHEKITFSPQINVITGNNGTGKTNILEAIYVLSHIKSFRNCTDNDIVSWCNNEYYTAADVIHNHSFLVEIGVIVNNNFHTKKVKIDGKEIRKLSDFYGTLKVVAFFPDDDAIINGSPDIIRKYFDRFICKVDSEYIELLSTYRKIIKCRNAVLKNIAIKRDIIKQLDIWDVMYSDCACSITAKREFYVRAFNTHLSELYRELSGFDDHITIQYKTSCAHLTSDDILNALVKRRAVDIQTGTTTHGPHRDCYMVHGYENKLFKSYASTGQRRLASIAMKLSEVKIINAVNKQKSVVMFDDVLSELDDNRKVKVLHNLIKGNHQVLITCTNMNDIVFINEYKHLKVENHRVYE